MKNLCNKISGIIFLCCVVSFLGTVFAVPEAYSHSPDHADWQDDAFGRHRHEEKGLKIRVDAPVEETDCAAQYEAFPSYEKVDEDGNITVMSAVMRDVYPGITNKIVTCIQSILTKASSEHFEEVRNKVSKIVSALLTIYIIWFATKVAFAAVQNPASEVMVVLFTILLVVYFVQSAGMEEFLNLFIASQEWLVDVVTRSIGSATGGVCEFNNVWQRIDCTIAYYIMFAQPEALSTAIGINPLNLDMSSDPFTLGNPVFLYPFVLMIGLLFVTPFGFVIALVVFSVMFLLIAAMVQAVLIYITALVALVFLGLIAPVMIPMVLFTATKQMFDAWLRILLGYIIQPALIMAYMAFMVSAISYAMDTGGLIKQYEHFQGDADERAEGKGEGNIGRGSFATVCSTTQDAQKGDECENPQEKQEGKEISNLPIPGYTAFTKDEEPQFISDNMEELEEFEERHYSLFAEGFDNEAELNEALRRAFEDEFGKSFEEFSAEERAEFDTAYSVAYDKYFSGTADPINILNTHYAGMILQNMLVLVVLLAITLGFLNNVINIGAAMTGVSSTQIVNITNVYNATADRISNSLDPTKR